MITIVKGGTILRVSRGAFRAIYKPLGFAELSQSKMREDAEVINDPPELPSDVSGDISQQISVDNHEDMPEDPEDEAEEGEFDTPLGEMTFTQLCAYAEHLNLEYDGIRSKKELRDLIRQNL